MIHRVEKGANAGWSAFEGSHPFRPSNPLQGPTLTHTPAIMQHPHREMRSVIGGLFYRGDALPELRDHYIYACYFNKRLWAFSYRNREVGTPFVLADSGGQVVAITENHHGEPIIVCHNGRVLKLEQISTPPEPKPWPHKLSETRLFADTSTHQEAPGVYRYATNAKSWSDGATRQHFIAIAPGDPMRTATGVEAGKSWIVPVGTAYGQTLSLGDRKIETQLLYNDGTWRGYTYRWDADGKDATLVPESGDTTEINGQQWRFQSRAECMTCHTHRSGFALSFRSVQLEQPNADGVNQIDAFISKGLLTDSRQLKNERGHPTPDPYDTTLPLGERARSYLDLNCAHCHRETGLGGRAGFQLLATLPLEETAIIGTKPIVGLTGDDRARVVAPGHPEHSELLIRMARRDAGRMPLIGSSVPDEQGIALIKEWIESLR